MNATTGLATWLAATIAVGAMARTRPGSRASLVVVALLSPLPALVVGSPVAKVVMAFVVIVLLVSTIDFAFTPRPATFASRMAHVFGFLFFVDSTHIKFSRRRFDSRGATQIFRAVLLAGAAIAFWSPAAALGPMGCYVARSLLSAMVVLALAEMTTGLVRLGSAAFGTSFPPVHDAPYLSRSLSEFWTRRWNLAVGGWLKRHCFSPLKQRGVLLALAGTFAASAVLHAYLFIAVDPTIALSWAAFFLVQPLMLLAERWLRVRCWPVWLARVWTIGILTSLLPLLLSPFLLVFHTSL